MSSRVNLSLLVDHMNGLPYYVNLDPNLKFKILYYCGPTTTTAPPPLKRHFPESYFSYDVSTEELKQMAAQSSLQGKVQAAFNDKLSAYVALLQRKTFQIPEDVLYVLLPLLCGNALDDTMLADIVVEVGGLMAKTS